MAGSTLAERRIRTFFKGQHIASTSMEYIRLSHLHAIECTYYHGLGIHEQSKGVSDYVVGGLQVEA